MSACGDDSSGSGDTSSTSSGEGGTGPTTTGTQATTGTSSTADTSSSTANTASTTSTSSSNTSSTSTSGAGGCYATFDAANDVLVAPVGSEVGLADGFSVGAFIDPDPLEVGGVAFLAGRHADGSSNGFYLALLNEGGTYKARLIVFTGNGTCTADADVPGPGTWQHVLGSFSSPDIRVFVDGQLGGSSTCGGTSNIDGASVVTIGRSETGVFPYGGSMDDVAYYAQPFSSAFDPTQLGCGSSAAMRYSFDGVSVGRTGVVAEDCGPSVDAQVGSTAGADGADPVFVCP